MSADAVELLANVADPEPPSPNDLPRKRAAAICLYRKKTINLLRRYNKLSMETGHLPSALGGSAFRAKISSYPLHTFEDAVIFVYDVELCLERLNEQSYEIVARVVFLGEAPEQAARAMQCSHAYGHRLLAKALDKLTGMFLRREILDRSKLSPKPCQGGKNGVFPVCS